jgi:4-hydroxy-tetrahydrodipicolinate reductase
MTFGGISATTATRLCVVGADGRMGSTIIQQAKSPVFEVVGAVTAPNSENAGRSLGEIGLSLTNLKILPQQNLEEALQDADIYISFTTPAAELANLPKAVQMGKKAIIGTTGFNEDEMRSIRRTLEGKVPAIISPNFSIGVNLLFKMIETCRLFPKDYDFSIVEAHHSGKADAPSGTAKKMADTISAMKGYSERIHGREGMSKRNEKQLELFSIRAGGIPGIHDLMIAGQHEMIRIEHVAFSRNVFAQGALYAAQWLNGESRPAIFDMEDVLGQRQFN